MEHELKEIISVTNFKGGVGKTTTVQSLAACLLRLKKHLRVLVVDMDPQCNLSMLLGWNAELKAHEGTAMRTVYDAMRDGSSLPVYKTARGIYYVPGSPNMQSIDPELYRQMQPKMVLAKCFNKLIDDHSGDGLKAMVDSFDYIFLDCPPALSESTYNALAVASGLLIPVQMEGLSVSGLGAIISEANKVKEDLNPSLEIRGLLPVMVDARPNIVRQAMGYLESEFQDKLLKTSIRRSVKMNEAQTSLKDIFEYAPYSTCAMDYEKVTKDLFEV